MEWTDEGILLQARPHGESSAIIDVFTPSRGRHAGVVRGGAGRRLAPVLQPGAHLSVTWRARLEDQLGHYRVEPGRGRVGAVLNDRLGLAGLGAVCALLAHVLPERAAFPDLYERSVTLLDLMPVTGAWPLAYLQWELAVLAEMGFALDLSRCAVTGKRSGLAHVSPRTGRAVSAEGAGDLALRLLPLPPCLLGSGEAQNAEIATALATTGHFLHRHVGSHRPDRPFPSARDRLVDLLARSSD